MDDDLPRLPGFREASLRRRRETIGALSEHRRAAGLSQTEVAARMGTSQSTVARLEAGEVDPRVSTLERYAEALGGRLDIALRFDPAHSDPAHPDPVYPVYPMPMARPESPSPERQQPQRPAAAHLPPPTAARPAARPSDRRW
jgi:transcriptional regulator with XRE-family HTH domain